MLYLVCDRLYVRSQKCMLVGITYGINGYRYIVAVDWAESAPPCYMITIIFTR
jgi:hypothetical protein